MSRERNKSNPVTIPIRMPGDMQTKIKAISKKSRLSEADVMRMALERGLTTVEKMFEQPASAAA